MLLLPKMGLTYCKDMDYKHLLLQIACAYVAPRLLVQAGATSSQQLPLHPAQMKVA
jgi:hypothetical protein